MSIRVGVILAPNADTPIRSGETLMPLIQADAKFSYTWMTHGLVRW